MQELHFVKTVEIRRTDARDVPSTDSTDWKPRAFEYILTFLAQMPQGCIVARRSDANSDVHWLYSTEPCDSLWPERFDGEILAHGGGYFRSLVFSLAMAGLDLGYMGGGTFMVRFKGESAEGKLVGMIFGNIRQIGYWIKLFVVEL